MITNIKNPRWSSLSHEKIIVDGIFENENVSFVASPTDCTEHGRIIFRDCIDGKYGNISEYSPPILTDEQAELTAQSDLDRRLKLLMNPENTARAEIDDDYKNEYKLQIKALLEVKKQKGWPRKIEWPTNS